MRNKELKTELTATICLSICLGINLKRIANDIPKYEGYGDDDRWNELLIKSKSTYKEELKRKFKVKALNTYEVYQCRDTELNKIPQEGEEWIVSKERMEILTGDNPLGLKYVAVVEEVKDKEKQDNVEEVTETEIATEPVTAKEESKKNTKKRKK